MKKVLLVLGVGAFLSFGLSSCSKSYSCDCGSGIVVDYSDLTKDQASALETACEAGGCEWSKN